MDNCTIDCIQIVGNFSRSATCEFVESACVQDTVQFIQAYYCRLDQSFLVLVLLSAAALALIFAALNALTNHYLMPCVEEFIDRLRLSQGMAGVTFLAFANGAPDVITAVVAGSSSSESTALIPFGSLYGAALFDMAFVLAMVIQFSPTQSLSLKPREALLPLAFYVGGSLYLIAVSFFYGRMNLLLALLFLGLYPVFIGFNLYEERKLRRQKKESLLQDGSEASEGEGEGGETLREQIVEVERELDEAAEEGEKEGVSGCLAHWVRLAFKVVFDYSIPPATREEWKPLRAIVSLVLSPLVSALSFGPVAAVEERLWGVPWGAWFSLPSVALLIHAGLCVLRGRVPGGAVVAYAAYSFVVVVCWITVVCSVLINLLELLQMLSDVNPVFLGLTVLAWANCIGDYLSITAFARRGNASTAVAGIFSGPLFTFLLGFGVSCALQAADGEYAFELFSLGGDAYTQISDSIVVAVIVMAVAYMGWAFVRIWRRGGQLGAAELRFAKRYYVAFLLAALLLSVLTDFFRTPACDL